MTEGFRKFTAWLKGEDIEDGEYIEYEEDDIYEEPRGPRRATMDTSAPRGSAGSNLKVYHGSGRDNVVNMPKKNIQIDFCFPKDLEQASIIVGNTRNDVISIVDLTGLELASSQRIVDFLSGAVVALDGEIKRLNNHMVLTAPPGVDFSNAELGKELKSNGIDFTMASFL